ncbi:pancreatic lipase-related protein 2-like [Copidosoma floridanum]|uniref:pancreatic lipase-related protein 2-like n=1 Tax=Copidosoma floridanum TaxID=29053 RepID=UPI0006C9C801|nr:pancreatic lipase-related protein 2-like [Copidosoma floridanum]
MISYGMKFFISTVSTILCLSSISEYISAMPYDRDVESTISDEQLQNDVSFFLFTREYPENPQLLPINDKSAIEKSAYDASRPTKFITHGWMNSYRGLNCITITRAFLAQDGYNVIVVDWSNIAQLAYTKSYEQVKAVGGHITKMISFLESLGSNRSDMSLVGHSLGAHVMGLAGYQAVNKVGHIVGLDPAGPGFYKAGPGEGISREDGKLVEIIHTNIDFLGISPSVGHADFYVNGGGPSQPGCGPDLDGFCAHARAYEFFAESITTPDAWLATQCDNYQAFLKGECSNNAVTSFPRWSNDGTIKMGSYFLRTKDRAPYGMGVEGAKPSDMKK